MERREFLAVGAGGVVAASLSGCTSLVTPDGPGAVWEKERQKMTDWKSVAHFMLGGGETPQWHGEPGFWYADPLKAVKGLNEDQLYWVPDPNSLCTLFHVGHIAHREHVHFAVLVRGTEEEDAIPAPFSIFGIEWCSPDAIRRSIPGVESVFSWFQEVRRDSHNFIASLSDADLLHVPESTPDGLSVAHMVFATAAHTAFHIGRIQLLRAMIEKYRENPC